METVRLCWVVPDDVRPGSTIIPYTDWGTGTIDYSAPVGPRVVARSRKISETAYGQTPYGSTPYAGGYGGGGYGCGLHARHPYGGWHNIVETILRPLYGPGGGSVGNGSDNGSFRFGAKLYDPDGRVSASDPAADEEVVIVVNTSPRGPSRLTASTLVAGVLTLTLTPSLDLQ